VFQVRRSSPEQSPPRRATPSPTTAPELTRTGRPASPRGPPPRAPTPPRTDAEPVPTKTSGADGGVLEQRRAPTEKAESPSSGSAGGRSGAGRRFKASFRHSDM
jgi:hypothetical protein